MRIMDWSSDVCSSDLPAIAVEDRRLRPGGQILSSDLEHWHAGAVFRGEEGLFDGIIVGVEIDLRRGPDAAFIGGDIIAVDRGRRREAGEGVEGLAIVLLAAEAHDRADSGQRDIAERRALEIVAANLVLHVTARKSCRERVCQ